MKYFSIRATKAMDSQADIFTDLQLQDMLPYSMYLKIDKLDIGQKLDSGIGEIIRIQNPAEDSDNLKFYFWDDVQAFSDYYSGMAFAIAANVQDAINLIVEYYYGTEIHPYQKEDAERLKNELIFTSPKIIDKPFGYVMRGSA